MTRKLAGATTETIPKAAAHFGVRVARLRKAVEDGEVPVWDGPGQSLRSPARVSLADVAAWIARENIPRELS